MLKLLRLFDAKLGAADEFIFLQLHAVKAGFNFSYTHHIPVVEDVAVAPFIIGEGSIYALKIEDVVSPAVKFHLSMLARDAFGLEPDLAAP